MRGFRAAAVLASMLLLQACASDPVVRLHSLVASGDVQAAAPTVTLSLRVNSVPLAVDQPQWLVRQRDDTLLLLEQERWAAPLRDELRAGLLQALAVREGVVDAGSAAADARLAADVTQFESLPGREARLAATWTLDAPQRPAAAGVAASATPLRCRSSWREPVGAGAPALAEGHRRIVGLWAAAIAQALRSGRCPD